nr:uncharacterized mitochondrial protein AtMg00810-like [Tanacetum cinerariifolium]
MDVKSTGSQDPQNTNVDVADDVFDAKENEKDVYVSLSRSAKPKKHDDKAKRDDRGKIGPNPTNNTNSFNTASPFDTAVSPNFRITGKSSFVDPLKFPDDPDMPELEDIVYFDDEKDVDPSKFPNDPDMPELEDIVYFDDEKDVGAEADFSNLETNIYVSPIPTTRVHNDYLVTQIISDLTLAPQTRSMARMVKEQGGLNQINDEDFHTSIEEEVYVYQPLGFEDLDYPDKVYKMVKALYGLHQAPRAWYETLANYLLENGFPRGKINQTLFIKKKKGDILIVQVYVDDIIFGSTNKELCKAFEKLMKDKFQMSFMGELTFFLGLQVKQKDDGIFISQDKYVAEILRKFGFTDVKSASTPIKIEKPLLKDPDSEDVDVHIYRYLKGKPHLGLWYPKDSPFNLVAYSDSDYAEASLDRKSTTRGCQFLGCRLIYWQCKKQTVVVTSSTEAEYVAAASCCAQLRALIDGKKVVVTKDVIRQDLYLDDADGVECLPNEEIFAELARIVPRGLRGTSSVVQWHLLSSALLHVENLISLSASLTAWRVEKGFSGVETPLFASMLDQPQPQAAEEEDKVEVPTAPTLPSPTNAPSPVPQDPTLTPHASPSSPTQEQPTKTSESSIPLLNTLLETCATLRKIEVIYVDEDITLVDVETQEEVADMDVELQGRITQEDVSVATKDANAVDPTVFDDEEVTMTMAQTLIKMKAEKAKLLDEHMAKRLHDEKYDDKEKNIDWNVVAEEIQEKHLDNIKKYQSLKRKPVSIAQARNNMIIYLKNMAGYKMEHFRGMTYDKVRPIFEREYKKVQTLFKPDKDVEEPQKKRV